MVTCLKNVEDICVNKLKEDSYMLQLVTGFPLSKKRIENISLITIPSGGRVTSWPFRRAVEELKSGIPVSGQGGS